MCASQKVGIIAGSGDLPLRLKKSLDIAGLPPVIGRLGVDFSVGQAGKIISYFKSQHVTDLVLVGGLGRPNWLTLRTDWRGFCIVSKLIFKILGDDALLKIIRRELEYDGFRVRGIHEFMPELLCPKGQLGGVVPNTNLREAVKRGYLAAKAHGAADLGQSVVVNAETGDVIGVEGRAGTDALMLSVRNLSVPKILVKVAKPQQDMALDMPTIGLKTIEIAHDCRFVGIACESGVTLVPDLPDMILCCNAYGLFLWGVSSDDI
ncbi:MAG: UDP-2,3-diacylglucosamine diphosphatase LpxI [Alphaproteobacteria bacterium]|jgi:DUF1009 family protein|nr:UDP-2,3-diacylglucosamine diphosphatase LpxI [Alphaproteobacteria bacterium]